MSDLYTDTGDGWLRSGPVRFFDALRPLMVPIDSVQQHPENDNNGDVDLVWESILVNGMYRPIQVQQSTGYILAGNTTWAAIASKGAQAIPVVYLNVDDIEALRILLADNQTARRAIPDNALTAAALEKIRENAGDLEGTGFTMAELEAMEAEAAMPLDLDPDPYEGWPTLSAMLAPTEFRDFMDMTEEADSDEFDGGNRGRVKYLMRRAGWSG